MEAAAVEQHLRRALSAIAEIETGLTEGEPEKALVVDKPIGKRAVKFALADIDDARDALFECGRRYGFNPQDLEGARL